MKTSELATVPATAELVEIIERPASGPPAPPPPPNPLLVAHALLRGRYKLAAVLALAGALVGSLVGYFVMRPEYRSTGTVKVNAVLQKYLYDVDEKGPMPRFDSFVDTQVHYLKNQRVIDLAVQEPNWKKLGRGISNESIAEFMDSLEVTRPKNSELIFISFTDRDPSAASAGVNAVIAGYMKLFAGNERESAAKRMKELNEHRNSLDVQIDLKRRAIAELAREFNGDPDRLERRYEFVADELNAQESKLWDTRVAIALAEARRAAATQPAGADSEAGNEELRLLLDPEMARLHKEKNRISREMQMSAYGPSHPQMERMRSNLAGVEQEVSERVALLKRHGEVARPEVRGVDTTLTLEQLRVQEHDARAQYEKREKETIDLGRKKLSIVEYKDGINVLLPRRRNVDDLIAALELELKDVGERIEVVSEGDVPPSPHKDRRRAIAAVGGIGMAGLAVGCVMLLGFTDRRLRGIADAHAHFRHGSKVLGIVPELEEHTLDFGSATVTAHCVHQIRAQLQMRRDGQRHATFAITSPSPGDGKTTLTIALGMSFAASGARTLLIDLDLIGGGLTARINRPLHRKIGQILLRNRRVTDQQLRDALGSARHSGQRVGEVLVASAVVTKQQLAEALTLQTSTSIGLGEILAGEPLDECVTATGMPNLSVLSLGSAGRDQVAQLSPESIRRLVADAQKTFDAILIDTGPILGSLEASMAAGAATGVVFAISRGGNTTLARRAAEVQLETGATLEGVVFNRADPQDVQSSSFSSVASRASQSLRVKRAGSAQLAESAGGRR